MVSLENSKIEKKGKRRPRLRTFKADNDVDVSGIVNIGKARHRCRTRRFAGVRGWVLRRVETRDSRWPPQTLSVCANTEYN